MNRKLIIGGIIVAVAISYAFSSPAAVRKWPMSRKDLEGKAVTSPNSKTLYRISLGLLVRYQNELAYINNGSPEIIMMTDEQLDAIGETTNSMVYEDGKIRQT